MSSLWPPSGIRMSIRVSDQPAFILRRREWRDTSLILELFSRDHGCISVIAKGASMVAAWPVSSEVNRSTSSSKRERISSMDDLFASGVFMDVVVWVSEKTQQTHRLGC